MTEDIDHADVIAASRGDVDAFGRLYRRRVREVAQLARRFICIDDVDDAVQEVFLRAWNNLGRFRGDSTFRTWLYRVAINVLLRRAEGARRETRRFVGIEEADHVSMQEQSVPEHLLFDVDAALASIPSDLRHVIVLHDIEGWSHAEIAEALRISTANSRIRLHRARLALRAFAPQQQKEVT